MTILKLQRIAVTVLTVTLAMALWAGYIYARTGGVGDLCEAAQGCDCHSDMPNANGAVTVAITGPQSVDVGTTNSYTISVTGGPSGTTGGFNLCADGGTLVAGPGTVAASGQLIHTNADNRSWTFEWTAPDTETSVEFTAVGQATDGAQTRGDSWNWYGGSAGSPFSITVTGPVPVEPITWGLLKDRYR